MHHAKVVGDFDFPEPGRLYDGPDWKPTTQRAALHRKVLVVARTRIEGTWEAYCFPVPGKNHDEEECLWETEGLKILDIDVAKAMFPVFADIPYAR